MAETELMRQGSTSPGCWGDRLVETGASAVQSGADWCLLADCGDGLSAGCLV